MILLNKVRSSFSAKVIVWVLLIAIPLFLLSVGLLYWQSRKLIRAEAEERANSVLKTAMQRINRYIITAETATNTYAWLDMPGDRHARGQVPGINQQTPTSDARNLSPGRTLATSSLAGARLSPSTTPMPTAILTTCSCAVSAPSVTKPPFSVPPTSQILGSSP